MRFLADENFPAAAVESLRSAGHDVVWVPDSEAGMHDRGVLDWLVRDERVLLTFDKDFGELAHATVLPPSCGIVLFRIGLGPPSDTGPRLAQFIASRDDWPGQFSVVEPGRIRMRPLRTGGAIGRAMA